jgi:hypothetical protein
LESQKNKNRRNYSECVAKAVIHILSIKETPDNVSELGNAIQLHFSNQELLGMFDTDFMISIDKFDILMTRFEKLRFSGLLPEFLRIRIEENPDNLGYSV